MKILICGDRDWKDREIIEREIQKAIDTFGDITHIIHGGCRGADKIAGEVASDLSIDVMEFPADWFNYGKKAGPIRNQQMLDEGNPDLVIAFHENIVNSKGTADMIRKAKLKGVKVLLIDR